MEFGTQVCLRPAVLVIDEVEYMQLGHFGLAFSFFLFGADNFHISPYCFTPRKAIFRISMQDRNTSSLFSEDFDDLMGIKAANFDVKSDLTEEENILQISLKQKRYNCPRGKAETNHDDRFKTVRGAEYPRKAFEIAVPQTQILLSDMWKKRFRRRFIS